MTNKALLSIIAILLFGVLSVGVIHAVGQQDSGAVFKRIGANLDEATEEVRDEIDDHTDDR